ncbi:TonB-dependent receptor [Pleomorphovibrio marinus]|uniref:TonB-dependent receptor n=1 Tax=Pleomorphovibrio marinus TaxID=2164132 RepID=UPI000E0A0188|nr:TonB-dependent receptor [Pleomorphovibrio marinus]
MKKILRLNIIYFIFQVMGFAQNPQASTDYTQTIRGQVMDQVTKSGLPGASVHIPGTDPVKGTVTDLDGNFVLEEVPTGRISLQISFIGYENAFLREIPVTSGKEVVLNITLREKLEQMEEVVIKAGGNPQDATNELAMVSSRGFDMEETNRYAGSRNDPARMAQNYAGVSGANDSRNDIIIRGNSPTGVLWRLEGIDIPNPNHFGAMGTTGGPVSILNNNLLGKSDFLTGAFPAQYGNATAGVFDLTMRKGNAHKREHLVQMGFNGFELGTEGPLGGENGASYLINYRYSTLALMQNVGFSSGTGAAIPYYQDLSFKLDIPTKNKGRFTLFGIGGKSNIDLIGSEVDSSNTDLYSEISQNIYNEAKMGVVGLTHTKYYNENTYGITSFSADYSFSGNVVDSLSLETREPVPFYRNNYGLTKYRAQYHFHQKLNNKNNYIIGFNYDLLGFNLQDSVFRAPLDRFVELRNEKGHSGLVQSFAQWQHRFTEDLSGTLGLHHQYFTLNSSQQVEPRMGLSYQPSQKATFSLGYGLHSQLQPLPIYFLESEMPNGQFRRTNESLDFTKSHHLVAGYQYQIAPDIRFKSEVYYQHLFNVAVEEHPSSFSILNAGADFGIPNVDSLVNQGNGRNYGLELTLEKSFSQSSYFLVTASLFDSKYQGSDGEWRNTAFNSQYVFNGLFGKEWKMGSNNRILSVDIKSTYAGGQYITPIDLEASILAQEAVYKNEQAYTIKNPAYFRTDLMVSYTVNKKGLTHEWSLDIQNVFNNQNMFRQTYNPISQQIVNSYQLGIFPIPQYRLTF